MQSFLGRFVFRFQLDNILIFSQQHNNIILSYYFTVVGRVYYYYTIRYWLLNFYIKVIVNTNELIGPKTKFRVCHWLILFVNKTRTKKYGPVYALENIKDNVYRHCLIKGPVDFIARKVTLQIFFFLCKKKYSCIARF